MTDRNVDRRGRPYTLAPANPQSLEPWLARDGQGGYLICLGTVVLATLSASTLALLKGIPEEARPFGLVVEPCAPHPAA